MNAPSLAVTGCTGRLGGRVARRLAGRGAAQRLIVRDPSRAPSLDGGAVVQASYADADAARRTLEGVSTLFMVSAAETEDRVDQHRVFIDAAAAAGVDHISYTSFFGAALDATFTLARDHYATEEHIKASGLRWTFPARESLPRLHPVVRRSGRRASWSRRRRSGCGCGAGRHR